jgi:iron complex outermembrane recepter protein
MAPRSRIATALAIPVAMAVQAAIAQQGPAPATPEDLDEVVVVGSNIRGQITKAVPVAVFDAAQIDAVGAVSGDELIRSIPQMGDISFNPANNAQTSNAARGDVGSINLRSLGVGNTLVLLNGRRVVTHPASQALSDTGTVPVLSFNSNALPVSGIRRLEVLLDGGAALYGSDAVAGVVNTVTRTDFDGLETRVQYGGAEATDLRELQVNVFAGHNFSRGNISLSMEYTDRQALRSEDQYFTATNDLRPLFAGTSFEGLTGADTRNTRGPWASLQAQTTTALRQGSRSLTSSAGAFHIKPASFGCTFALGTDICLGTGALPLTGTNRALRYDTARNVTVLPDVKRVNSLLTGNYELGSGITAFGEFGYYAADTFRLQPPVINLNALWIPANNYYNPFGPVTFSDGRTNPNRIPGLTNVPAAGLPVRMTGYRFSDAGPQDVNVDNLQVRALFGLRGNFRGFDWDSAIVHSAATARDVSHQVDSTKLQQQLGLSTPDAYNPFSGGCVADPSYGDCSPSSKSSIDAISFDLRRASRTTLTMVDLKVSRGDLFSIPGGDVGIAFGAEVRRETQKDDRDSNVDGTIKLVDAVSGEVTDSNAAAVSPNPDAYGSRRIGAAYVEFAVPLVSRDWNLPLIRQADLQLAARAESYSDFGEVLKPKAAVAWDVFDGLRLRASYSEGFRAPNLEQMNVPLVTRNANGQDLVRCEADLRAGRITDFARCGNNLQFSRRVSGNPDLKPEESRNFSYGVVFQPEFLPEALGQFTLTADRWSIKQEKLIGILGIPAALAQDYLAQLSGGSNPNIVRATPNADDIAFFAGTGITPQGTILAVKDQYVNLLPQTVEGVDIGLLWTLKGTALGDFNLNLNGTYLDKFERAPGPAVDTLYAARAAGEINAATPLPEGANLVRQDGRPRWRASGTLTWSKGPVQVGLYSQYIGDVEESGFVNAAGDPWIVASQTTANLYAQYTMEKQGWTPETRVRIGSRNITDKDPPLTSEGFLGTLYSPYARYWYMNVAMKF